jgi:hypothetical protein
MRRSASEFFLELNYILLDNYILQVCKLTDKAVTRVGGAARLNLTVAHLNELLSAESLLTPDMEIAAEGLQRYRALVEPARNRTISHADKETAMTYTTLGAHTEAEALEFFDHLYTYIDAVGVAVGEGSLDFSTTSGPGDVADLFKALNGGVYLRDQ